MCDVAAAEIPEGAYSAVEAAMMTPAIHFDPLDHQYFLNGERVPSITQLLKTAGVVDDTWFTPESRERGTAVHDLTRDVDLGVPASGKSWREYAGYVEGYIACLAALQHPKWVAIEEPDIHAALKFGGRPDRLGPVFGRFTVAEIKSGVKMSSHRLQTALQAILVAPRYALPAEAWQRLAVYLTATGRYKVELHEDKRDFDEARRILKRCGL